MDRGPVPDPAGPVVSPACDAVADFPAMTWEDAVATEAAYAQELRELRYAVYQH
jgi:hypothetical protein